ncbi:hypothetical protein BS78_K149300 [Paspalum vaginatum]|uniref:Uncharacterized protein n=1 Tax=Paspalum vaginatum TaxID=158149 RepID=A0A9W8CGF6_9POAL|nr:hypothetical protein BS78_K149300 [Paspalum vaginatum]
MAGRVQDFVTIRIGSLWIDVLVGPLLATNSAESLRTTAASPTVVAHEQEVNSKPEGEFIPVISKAAKRRARRAAAAARATALKNSTTNVRRAAPSRATPLGSSKPARSMPPRHEVKLRYRQTTLGEWPVQVKRQKSAKSASSAPTKTTSPTFTEELGECSTKPAPSILRAPPTTSSRNPVLLAQAHRPQPCDKGKTVMKECNISSTEGSASSTNSRLRVDAPEFIPSPVYNSGKA